VFIMAIIWRSFSREVSEICIFFTPFFILLLLLSFIRLLMLLRLCCLFNYWFCSLDVVRFNNMDYALII